MKKNLLTSMTTSGATAVAVTLALASQSCGVFQRDEAESPDPGNAQFLALSDVRNAPDVLRNAAKSVVMIITHEDGRGATGSFISGDGLLMTNDHVLGRDQCPKSGCYIRLYWDLEAGGKSEWRNAFATPKVVAPELDLAVLQIDLVDDDGGNRKAYKTSNYLELADASSGDLVGTQVFSLGHPSLGLKKWSAGKVYETQGDWFVSDQFTLPGSSGSPILNARGQIVGLNHRGSNGHGSITQYGIRHDAIATSSGAIVKALSALQSGDDAVSLALATVVEHARSTDDFIKNSSMYLRAHRETVTPTTDQPGIPLTTDSAVAATELLADYIDRVLADPTQLTGPQDLDEFSEPAGNAIYWLSCHDNQRDLDQALRYKTCPDAAGRELWRQRFAKIYDKQEALTGERAFSWISEIEYYLADSSKDGDRAGLRAVENYADGKLDFEVAVWMTSYMQPKESLKLGGDSVAKYLLDYAAVPYHERHFRAIINGLGLLYANEVITKVDLQVRLQAIMNDTQVTLSERLRAERIAFRYGVL